MGSPTHLIRNRAPPISYVQCCKEICSDPQNVHRCGGSGISYFLYPQWHVGKVFSGFICFFCFTFIRAFIEGNKCKDASADDRSYWLNYLCFITNLFPFGPWYILYQLTPDILDLRACSLSGFC